MYCVLEVAVNLNHCSPLDEVILPLAHVLAESVVALEGSVVVEGAVEDVLNAIWYVPVLPP